MTTSHLSRRLPSKDTHATRRVSFAVSGDAMDRSAQVDAWLEARQYARDADDDEGVREADEELRALLEKQAAPK